MKKFFLTSILLSVSLILVTAICISSFVLLCIRGVNASLFTPLKKAEYISPNQLAETFDYGSHYLSNIVFIADKALYPIINSQTELNKSQVWSGAGGSLPLDYNLATRSIIIPNASKSMSIADAIEQYKPQYIIIAVGLENGVSHCTEAKFKEYYSRLIESIQESSPDAKIILQSILPVSKAAEKADPSISNERIDQANEYIMSIAEQYDLRYLNVASALKNSKGRLDSKYDSGNGITLNAEGYNLLLQYIRTHGYK